MLNLLFMARKIYSVWVFWDLWLKNLQNINIFESTIKFWKLENMPLMQNVFSIYRAYLIFSCNIIFSFKRFFYAVVMILKAMPWNVFSEFHSTESAVGFKVVFCDTVLYHKKYIVKDASATFLLVWLVCQTESTCETRKNVFSLRKLFSFLRYSNSDIQIFKYRDVIKCLSMKHEAHLIG